MVVIVETLHLATVIAKAHLNKGLLFLLNITDYGNKASG